MKAALRLLFVLALIASNIPLAQAASLTASPNSGRAPLVVTLSGVANNVSYDLDFGDGSAHERNICSGGCAIQTAVNVSHTYVSAGTYVAKLTSYNAPQAPYYTTVTYTIQVASAGTSNPAPTCRLFASNTIVGYNTRVRLDWASHNATGGYLTAVGTIAPNGSAYVVPGRNTTYAASFNGPGGTIVCRVAVAVQASGPSTGSGAAYSGGVVNIDGATDIRGSSIDTTGSPINTNNTIDTTGSPIDTSNRIDTKGSGIDTNAPVNTNGTVDLGGKVVLPTAPSVAPSGSSGGFVGGIVPQECRGNSTVANCDLCSLAQMGQNLANFMLGLTIPAAALLFAWAGILYFSSRGNPTQITQAHKVFKTVVIGFVIAVSAWVLVNTVMNMLIQGGDLKSWNWSSLRCTETRKARLYNMSLDQYLSSLKSTVIPYTGSFVSTEAGCPAGATPEGGRCIDYTGGRAIDVGAVTGGGSGGGGGPGGCAAGDELTAENFCLSSNGVVYTPGTSSGGDSSSGPGGSCPAGYKYASNSRESWCDSLTDNTWVDTDGSGVGTGSTYGVAGNRCDANNPACGTQTLSAAGLNDRQANAMACIAVTESGGNPYTSDSETSACGTFQITNETTRSNWQNPRYHGPGCSINSSCNDAACNTQTAVIMFNEQSYQPWTGVDTRTGQPWNPNARRCVEQYDPSAVRW